MRLFFLLLLTALLLAACVKAPPVAEKVPGKPPVEVPAPPQPTAVAVDFTALPGWGAEDPAPALKAFRRSCSVLQRRPGWLTVCRIAQLVDEQNPAQVSTYFRSNFTPYRLQNESGKAAGLITGYYVPDLHGSRQKSEHYSYPLYRVPDDLLVVELASIYPELGDYRLRGRIEGRRVVPYWDRGEIDSRPERLDGDELFWVDDPVELFFLHIQGSGRILLPDGERVMVNYADQNGHPYRSIGAYLIRQGSMSRDQMSMQNIRRWARQHPGEVRALLDANPSYVFFRALPASYQSPPGALGVPLTPERSLAVDPRRIPLGAPVYLSTSWPGGSSEPLQRLMVAQDTGGAIKGEVRADFFWGMGAEAGALAGRMKQDGYLWVLLPKGMEPPRTGG